MLLKTLEDYDRELSKMENTLTRMEKYIEKHPEKLGYAGNYETLKYIYNIYKQERTEFVEDLTDINLNLKGKSLNNGLTVHKLSNLIDTFNQIEKSTENSDDFIVKSISNGSEIQFGFKNPTDEDVKRTSPRKKRLVKIFEFIECSENIDKLKEKAGNDGKDLLFKYKEFLKEIVRNNADFTLDTEKGSLKSGLSLEQSKNICKNLKIKSIWG